MDHRAVFAQRTKEIVTLHLGIEASLRRSVQDAIKIGELLAQQKTVLPHGAFTAWIERELPFTDRTARNYMSVYEHRSKTESVSDLQTAYKVAQIEDQRAGLKREADRRRKTAQLERTGEKPEDWDRSDDHALKQERKQGASAPPEAPDAQPAPPTGQDEREREPEERPPRGRARAITDSSGPEAVLTVLSGEIDTLLAGLPDDIARHSVINGLIKRLREMSIALNRTSLRKAGVA